MTETDEVAAAMPPLPHGCTMHEARQHARRKMPDESIQVIDNVAEALLRRRDDDERALSLASMRFGDRIDARALMAIEATREAAWRKCRGRVTPSQFAEIAMSHGDSALREWLETENGEPLL